MLKTFSKKDNPSKGDIHWVQFSGIGAQRKGRRPAVVVQNDFINQTSIKTTLVCPLTKKNRGLRTHPCIKPHKRNGLDHPSSIVSEQVNVVNKNQLEKKIGTLSASELHQLNNALGIVFDLPNT